MLSLNRGVAESLLTEVGGHKGVAKWPEKRVVNGLKKLAKAAEAKDLDGGEYDDELEKVIVAVKDNVEIKVEAADDDDEDEAPKKKGSKKSGKKSAKAEKADKKSSKKSSKKRAAAEKDKGPGVIGTIVECLTNATAKKPISKADIVEKLAKRFPDRDKESMAKTVNVQVPTRISAEKGLTIKKNEHGYWAA